LRKPRKFAEIVVTEFAEFREFLNQELFTPRPKSVLSQVEGRLRGAISEPYFIEKPEPINVSAQTTSGSLPSTFFKAVIPP